jgi:Tfp pilus assembly ATPase PilU
VPSKYILEGRALELHDYIRGAGNGMQTFDQDLLALHRQELITVPEALRHATNPEALQMALRGISSSKSNDAARQGSHHAPPRPPAQMPGSQHGHG